MEAVIATGGKQYLVAPGQVIKVERLDGDAGAAVEFTSVLLVQPRRRGDRRSRGAQERQGVGRGASPRAGAQGLGREVQAAEELSASPRSPADRPPRCASPRSRSRKRHGAQEGCRQLAQRSRLQSPDAGGEALRRPVRHRRLASSSGSAAPASSPAATSAWARTTRCSRRSTATSSFERAGDSRYISIAHARRRPDPRRRPAGARPRSPGVDSDVRRRDRHLRQGRRRRRWLRQLPAREASCPAADPTAATAATAASVFLEADPALTTLLDFHYQRHYHAERGQHGKGSQPPRRQRRRSRRCACRSAPWSATATRGEPLGDLTTPGQRLLVVPRRARRARQRALRLARPTGLRAAPISAGRGPSAGSISS